MRGGGEGVLVVGRDGLGREEMGTNGCYRVREMKRGRRGREGSFIFARLRGRTRLRMERDRMEEGDEEA